MMICNYSGHIFRQLNSYGVLNYFGFLELQTCNPYGIGTMNNVFDMTP